jgi:uncharacterized membrane protein
MHRKGFSGGPMWLIVSAVIALIVLVVVVFIFGSQTGKISGTLSACEMRPGAYCTEDNCEINKEQKILFVDCPTAKPNCCMPLN